MATKPVPAAPTTPENSPYAIIVKCDGCGRYVRLTTEYGAWCWVCKPRPRTDYCDRPPRS